MKQTLVKPNIRLSYQGRVRGCKLQCAICYLSTSKLSWRMEDFFSREICVTYIPTYIYTSLIHNLDLVETNLSFPSLFHQI